MNNKFGLMKEIRRKGLRVAGTLTLLFDRVKYGIFQQISQTQYSVHCTPLVTNFDLSVKCDVTL